MSTNTAPCVVSLTQSSRVELNVNLVLDEKSSRLDQKLKTLSQYVQQYPSGWKKRLELANLLYAMGCIEQAVDSYRQVIERQPQLIGVRLKLGKVLQLMGRKAQAIAVYESALCMKTSPPSPLLANQRGVRQDGVRFFQFSEATRQHIVGAIAVCKGDTHGARAAFESAASLEPGNAAHWLALGQVQMGREDAVAALRAFDAVLSLKPDDIVALIYSYDVSQAVAEVREASQRLSKLLELAPDDFRVLKRQVDNRCRMRLVSGESGKQTKQMISSALRLAPDAADAHELQAYYHIFRGEWAKGVGVLAQFTESHPNNPSGWYYLGRCLFHTGEYQAAAVAMLKAYRLYPNDCEIYRALCEIRHHSGKCTDVTCNVCTKDFWVNEGSDIPFPLLVEEMLERFPERWSVWATAGRVLVECFQEIERGCSVSAMGTQLQPQLADAWFRHGRVLAGAEKHREAVEALEQGWQLLPSTGGYLQSVPAAVWLGESYRVLGDDAASRRWWEEAGDRAKELMEFDPATAHYWLGRALLGLGDVASAMEAYRTALSQQLLYPTRGEVEKAHKTVTN